MSRKFILSESSYDFKYRNILSNIPNIEVIEGSYFSLLRLFLKKNTYYHIRYIKFRGYIRTFFRLAIIYLIAKISGNKVIWSCHNIYEHNIPSTRYNDIIRNLLCKYVDNIIVFHRDILKYLPKRCHHKTTVASFGDFRDFIYSQTDINEKFQEKYTAWLTSLQVSQPAVISISAAKRNSLDLLFKVADLHRINVLAIAPNLGKKVNESLKAYQIKYAKQMSDLNEEMTEVFTTENDYQHSEIKRGNDRMKALEDLLQQEKDDRVQSLND